MLVINETNFEKAREKIKESKEPVIFSSNDDDLNRRILEKEKISVLLLNQNERKDKLKQRNSGFNHVLAKIAKKNNISIGINLDEIIESKEKSKTLARISQNIKLCNKSKLKMKFIAINEKNKRNLHDLKSLGLILGMPTWMTKTI